MIDFKGKKIAVLGMARSGLAAADVLCRRGACVTLYDSKPEAELESALDWAAEHKITACPQTPIVAPCDLLVTSPGVPKNAQTLVDAAHRGIEIWGEIEAAYRIAKAPILAITGSNGKTTTTALLGEITRAGGFKTFVAGNIAAGEIALPLIIAADEALEGDVIVAEISSFQLEWTPSFKPKVAAILNITPDHMNRQTWDEYVASKWNIFAHLGHDDTAVLRSDIPSPFVARDEAFARNNPNRIYFDHEPAPEWIGRLQIPGAHNAENAMAAALMARSFGIDEKSIMEASLAFTGVVHRLEYVTSIGGAKYINNSMCTNNDAFARSLDAVSGPKIVLAGGVYKGGDKTEFVQAAIKSDIKRLIVFGRSGDELKEAVGKTGFSRVDRARTMSDAVKCAFKLAESGDTVILNPGCASFDEFNDFEHRGNEFKKQIFSLADR